MVAAIVLGYFAPLFVLELRFGFDDDDIPIGYGFDLALISGGAIIIGIALAVWLGMRIYRSSEPRDRGLRPEGSICSIRATRNKDVE